MQQEPGGVRRLISAAFEGDSPPAQLSVGLVTLVELCQLAMPDPNLMRAQLLAAGFVQGKEAPAMAAASTLALETNIFTSPVRNLRHTIYGNERLQSPVIMLLSEGDTDKGGVVFASAVFREAIEADVVKAVTHVTGKTPLTGSTTRNAEGKLLRRVFWDTEYVAGVQGIVASGPENVEATHLPRAITAFAKSGARPAAVAQGRAP
ncbi:MAG: hypothetical protein K2P58_00300 [Hyphomonadaceae bacterium]|nr:hypothetical protein [Hyphomonadaceae bacterium]